MTPVRRYRQQRQILNEHHAEIVPLNIDDKYDLTDIHDSILVIVKTVTKPVHDINILGSSL